MNTKPIDSLDPGVHSQNIQSMLEELIAHTRADLYRVKEPRFKALLETSAVVLKSLQTAFAHYSEGEMSL
jgi:hypothetical protein